MKKTTGFYPRLSVDTGGRSAVGQAGGVLLTSTVRAAGLDVALSAALAPWRPAAVHDPAKVLLDLALTLALGGDTCSDLAVVRAEPAVFGRGGLGPDDVAHDRGWPRMWTGSWRAIDRARADARARVWAAAGPHAPDHDADAGAPVIIDIDATLVTAHSTGIEHRFVAGIWPVTWPKGLTAPCRDPSRSDRGT